MNREQLIKARNKLGLTQDDFGKMLDMSRTMIGFMERGHDGSGNDIAISTRTELAVRCLLTDQCCDSDLEELLASSKVRRQAE